MSGPTPSDEAFASAVAEFERLTASGQQPSLESFCRRYPEIREELLDVLRVHLELGHADSGGTEAPRLPDGFGHYRVIEEIGRGGMAWVFRARDERLDRDVALKVLPPDPLWGTARRERFQREARALARLDHPRVVTIFDVGQEGDYSWLAMELMQGSLADWLHGAQRSADEITERVAEAALGLQHLHERGIVHRDVKPSNLLLDADGRVRVGDLGLAVVEGEDTLTRTGQAPGTALFASPEQMRGESATPRSDVYGLAATLWQLLTRRPPPLPGARLERAGLPRPLHRVLARALSADAPERPASVAELARAIAMARRSRSRSWRWPASLAGAALLVVAGLVANFALRERATLPGAMVHLASRRSFETDPLLASLRARSITWDELASTTPATELTHDLAGRLHVTRFSMEGTRATLTLHDGEELVARSTFVFEPGSDWLRTWAHSQAYRIGRELVREALAGEGIWRLHPRPVDVDGDGVVDVVLASDEGLVFVKWDVLDVMTGEMGWKTGLPHRPGLGSPAVADRDGDGELEVLVGDAGDHLVPGPSELHQLDFATGRIERTWQLPRPIHSTVQFDAETDGRVLASYIDVELEGAFGTNASASLHRITRSGRLETVRVPTDGVGRFTWPVFQDVDGDGDREMLFGRYESGDFWCTRTDGELVWRYPLESYLSAYPLLSQQDEDGRLEACFGAFGRFVCLNTEPKPARRVAWDVELEGGEIMIAKAVEIADLDGDGLAELAVPLGDRPVVLVLSRRGIALELTVPGETWFEGRPPHLFGRVAWVAETATEPGRLVLLTGTGWLVCWSVTDAGGRLDWVRPTHVTAHPRANVTASLQVVDHPALDRPAVLAIAGLVELLDVGPIGSSGPRILWSSWTPLSSRAAGTIHGTPVVVQEDERTWVVLTTEAGHACKLPLIVPRRSQG